MIYKNEDELRLYINLSGSVYGKPLKESLEEMKAEHIEHLLNSDDDRACAVWQGQLLAINHILRLLNDADATKEWREATPLSRAARADQF